MLGPELALQLETWICSAWSFQECGVAHENKPMGLLFSKATWKDWKESLLNAILTLYQTQHTVDWTLIFLCYQMNWFCSFECWIRCLKLDKALAANWKFIHKLYRSSNCLALCSRKKIMPSRLKLFICIKSKLSSIFYWSSFTLIVQFELSGCIRFSVRIYL